MQPPGNRLRIAWAERRTLLISLAAVAGVRTGLTLLRYRRLRRLLPHKGTAPAPEPVARRTAWGVARAAKWVPGATCLTQALACQHLLGRRGYASDVRIGVTRTPAGRFQAHAWLLSDGRVVIGDGGDDLSKFSVLTDLGRTGS